MATNLTPQTLTISGETGNAAELQFLVTLQVAGKNLGVFDSFTGGDVTATPPKHRPGGMQEEISYLALPSYGNLTITRVYDEGRDHRLIGELGSYVGTQYATVNVQPLDADANPYGKPRSYYGRIAKVDDGKADSQSATPRMWTLDLSVQTRSN